MDELSLYICGSILIIAIFITILEKVLKEIDSKSGFVDKFKKEKEPISKEKLLANIDFENQKCQLLCDELEKIFDEFINKFSDENYKNKALALKSVLLSIKTLSSDELKDKLLQLLPEFEQCINDGLGQSYAKEFLDISAKKYNEIFKD